MQQYVGTGVMVAGIVVLLLALFELYRLRILVRRNEALAGRLRPAPQFAPHTHEVSLEQLHDVATALCKTCKEPVRVRWVEERVP